jgi:enoyl-[acyl-carrier protein] reductase I
MIDLKGKVAIVFGLANKRSIAYGVAQKLAEAGATLVLSYQSERLRGEAEQLLEDLGQTGAGRAFQCDVSRDEDIDALFNQIATVFPKIDVVIHSVAFAPADAIKNDFLLTSRDDFRIYNVMGVAKAGLEAAVRYLAASLGTKNIRVNAVSSGPLKTLAARGIGDFSKILDAVSQRAPLHRNVEQGEVGNTALFLCSPLASGITGEVTFVDCGFNITGI